MSSERCQRPLAQKWQDSRSLLQPNGEALEAASCCSEVMESQETLFADYYKNGNISNLIFHTDHPLAWYSAILPHYPSVKREEGVEVETQDIRQ